MEYLLVSFVALLTSGLTLFSGFGLGTLLLPAFLLFFPADLSVAMTAIVHLLNNIFKLILLGRHANLQVVIRFGAAAIVAAIAGAALLVSFSDVAPLASYSMFDSTYIITPVKLLMGILIALFALLEMLPALRDISFHQKYLPLGGLLSGFFGGLSGHQGALRSAFLIRAGLSKEAFIATGVVIACLVDVTRIGVYAQHFSVAGIEENAPLLISATLAAFLGAFIGNKMIKKVTLHGVQIMVSVLLIVVAVGIGSGIL